MSHKPTDVYEVNDIKPEQLHEELNKHIAYIQQHDPKNLEFVLMLSGHRTANDNTRVCATLGGPPQAIAHILTHLVNELVARDPAFAVPLILNILQHVRASSSTDEEDAEMQTKELLDRLRNGSIH